MKSAHSGKAIMFTNGKMMSERLFEPLSSAAGSIALMGLIYTVRISIQGYILYIAHE